MELCPDCKQPYVIGKWPFPCGGKGHEIAPRDAQIHASEKVKYYEAPDGTISIPGRADRPMHPKMAAAGYQERICDTHSQIRQLENRSGKLHEISHYDKNSAKADRDMGAV